MSATEQNVRTDRADFTGALERLRKASADFAARWHEWAAGQPQEARCERHGVQRRLDEDASLRRSWADREMRLAHEPCAKCAAEDAIRARSDELRLAGVLDENVLHARFDNFQCRTATDESNLAAARRFAERLRGFIVMLGPVGTGKTHLAVAIMRAVAARSRFTTHGRLLRALRETYRDDRAEDPVRAFSAVRLFVLDEVGMSAGGRDELPLVHDILSARHEARKPTVLTTNLDEDGFRAAVGERMHDRLSQSGVAKLWFAGESMRSRFRKDYHGT